MYLKSMYPDVPNVPAQNIHDIIFHRADQKDWENYTLHIDAATGRKRTYHEFYERVMDGATALGSPISVKGLGLQGDSGGHLEIVGILGENSMDYITLIHSLLAITTPYTMFSHYYTPFELARALRLCKATRIFVQPKFLALVEKAAKDVGFPDDCIYIFEGQVKGKRSFDEMLHQVRKDSVPRVAIRPAGKDTLAYLVFSSGTSGLPKTVMISHGNLVYSLLQFMVLGIEVAKVYTPPAWPTPEGFPVSLAFLPLHHTYGLHLFCFRSFLSQATLVLLPQWDVDLALKLIPKYKVTHISLIPSIAHQLVSTPKAKHADFSSLRWVNSGAAYLPQHLARRLTGLVSNVTLTEGYGLSEATVAACSIPSVHGMLGGRAKRVPDSAGILFPGMEARIVREDGSDSDTNEPGELWLKGGNIALGYWDNEQANRETFVDVWLKTGDLFQVDEDGTFYFQDRAKDTLKISGMQVAPVEIENTLLAHPDKLIVDATVAGVSGGRTSDEKIPRAWVVLSEVGKQKGKAIVVAALDAWTRKNLSKYKRLRGGIDVVDEIPKSPTGKVLRRALQDKYDQRMKKPRTRL